MSRISKGGVRGRNPFGPDWGTKSAQTSGQVGSVGQQVQSELFGKKKPPILDDDDAEVAALMGRLHAYRKKLARLAGDAEEDYDLVLASGTIAMIDSEGLIYVGKGFLLSQASLLDVHVGVLAHEIGHRPKRWAQYKERRVLSKADREELCRLEETRADYFAGRALAELGLSFQPLVSFLRSVQTRPHPEYFSVELRASCIEDGFVDGRREARNRKKYYPELSRMTDAKGDLGIG